MSITGGRLGPRPISLHMAMAMWTWNGSLAALPLVQNGSMQWMPKLAAEAARLTQALREAETPALASAVEEEAAARTATLVGAIDSYRAHPYSRDVVNPDATSAFGTATMTETARLRCLCRRWSIGLISWTCRSAAAFCAG